VVDGNNSKENFIYDGGEEALKRRIASSLYKE
jgi:hypothetical protein